MGARPGRGIRKLWWHQGHEPEGCAGDRRDLDGGQIGQAAQEPRDARRAQRELRRGCLQGGAPAHPDWYRNLVEHPLVEVQDEATKGDYVARQLSGEEREQWWQRAVDVWPDYADYQTKTDREIPVFILEPAKGEMRPGRRNEPRGPGGAD